MVVVTDLDGTFWLDSGSVPLAHLEAVEGLAAMDVPVIAATSRRVPVVRGLYRRIGVSFPSVCLDGAMITDEQAERILRSRAFSSQEGQLAVETFAAMNSVPVALIADATKDVVVEGSTTTAFHAETLSGHVRDESLRSVCRRAVVCGLALASPRPELLGTIVEGLESRLEISYTLRMDARLDAWLLNVGPKGVDKWTGTRLILQHRDLSTSKVVAVGDAENDRALLEHADLSVWVEGGDTEIRRLADHVIPSPRHCGWSAVPDIVEGFLGHAVR